MRHLIGILEEAIAQLGIQPEETRGERPGTWLLQKGEAKILIELLTTDGKSATLLQISAPLVPWPSSNQQKVAVELLRKNHQLIDAGYSLFENTIYLRISRETAGLDVIEAIQMIAKMGHYAEELDEWLKDLANERVPIGFKNFVPAKDK
ncbi:MAG: YbjN domain-containing protein [Bacteroidia bacterium]|nr:YbjN domain-containing protein [Bacteroidia bacterium]